MLHGHLDYFQKTPLGGRPNTKPRDHGIPNAHNHWFTLFDHAWGPAWIESHQKSIWLRARSHMTSHYTLRYVTTLHDFGGVLGRPLDTSFRALTIFMVTALGSCVKWPWEDERWTQRILPKIRHNIILELLWVRTFDPPLCMYWKIIQKLLNIAA